MGEKSKKRIDEFTDAELLILEEAISSVYTTRATQHHRVGYQPTITADLVRLTDEIRGAVKTRALKVNLPNFRTRPEIGILIALVHTAEAHLLNPSRMWVGRNPDTIRELALQDPVTPTDCLCSYQLGVYTNRGHYWSVATAQHADDRLTNAERAELYVRQRDALDALVIKHGQRVIIPMLEGLGVWVVNGPTSQDTTRPSAGQSDPDGDK